MAPRERCGCAVGSGGAVNDLFAAALMGVIEGLTEFVPVSSTGHLILTGHLLRVPAEIQKSFDLFIQSGAIFAVLCAYPGRFADLFRASPSQGLGGRRGWALLGLTTLPAVLAGLLLHGFIERHAFKPPTVAIGLAAGAAWMLWAERRRSGAPSRSLENLRGRDAIGIGAFQCLALWPGVSRSAATILGGMALGMDRRSATEYSFLAAVPVLLLAGLYSAARGLQVLSAAWLPFFAIGFMLSFVFGLLSIRFLIRFLGRHRMDVFAWYRLALAAAVLWWNR